MSYHQHLYIAGMLLQSTHWQTQVNDWCRILTKDNSHHNYISWSKSWLSLFTHRTGQCMNFFDYSDSNHGYLNHILTISIYNLNPDQGCTSLTMATLSCWKPGEPGLMSPRRVRLGGFTLWKMAASNFHSSTAFVLKITNLFWQAEGATLFRYPSYVQDIMGDIFSLGFGPFRWPFVGNSIRKIAHENRQTCTSSS